MGNVAEDLREFDKLKLKQVRIHLVTIFEDLADALDYNVIPGNVKAMIVMNATNIDVKWVVFIF